MLTKQLITQPNHNTNHNPNHNPKTKQYNQTQIKTPALIPKP